MPCPIGMLQSWQYYFLFVMKQPPIHAIDFIFHEFTKV